MCKAACHSIPPVINVCLITAVNIAWQATTSNIHWCRLIPPHNSYAFRLYLRCCSWHWSDASFYHCPQRLWHTLPFIYAITVHVPDILVIGLQYSKFIKNGWTILDTSTDTATLAAMYQHSGSSTELAVVTTNTDTSSTTTNWDFGSMPMEYAVEVYRTSASENCTRLADVSLPTSGLLQYDLPAQSITTFHFTTEADGSSSAAATAG